MGISGQPTEGFGLRNMRDRARLVDGEIEIQGDHVAKIAGELQKMGYRVKA